MQVSVTVCDVDKEVGRETRHYTVKSTERSVEVDLCDEHAAPLESLLLLKAPAKTAATATPRKAARKGTKRSRTQVVTLGEIERLKS